MGIPFRITRSTFRHFWRWICRCDSLCTFLQREYRTLRLLSERWLWTARLLRWYTVFMFKKSIENEPLFLLKGVAVTLEQCSFSTSPSIHQSALNHTAVLPTTISRAVRAMEIKWLTWETVQKPGNIYLLWKTIGLRNTIWLEFSNCCIF